MLGTFKPKYSIEGLMKLLMFGDYVKAKAVAGNVTMQSVIEGELQKYPYKRANAFIVRMLIFVMDLFYIVFAGTPLQ